MKFAQFFTDEEFQKLKELAPSAVGVGTSPTLAPQPGQATIGVDPLAAQKAQAMQVKQVQDQKKALQDQIKQKQTELQDLQKKLAELG